LEKKEKIEGKKMKTRGMIILICLLLSVETSILVTPKIIATPSAELAIFSLSYGWGNCITGTDHSDFYSPESFRMGIANNGTTKFTLKEINITYIGYTRYCGSERTTGVYNENVGLPITLYPQHYWLYNVTWTPVRTIIVEIEILINNLVIDFGEAVFYSLIPAEYNVWPNWVNYSLYREYKGIPESLILISGFTTLIGIILVVLIRSLKKIPV
jgi:hypothetical protein